MESKIAKGWPKKLEKGRFTSYCKQQGFEGPCRACADKAMDSDDPSVRGMASFYLNTTLKRAKMASRVALKSTVKHTASAETDEFTSHILDLIGLKGQDALDETIDHGNDGVEIILKKPFILDDSQIRLLAKDSRLTDIGATTDGKLALGFHLKK